MLIIVRFNGLFGRKNGIAKKDRISTKLENLKDQSDNIRNRVEIQLEIGKKIRITLHQNSSNMIEVKIINGQQSQLDQGIQQVQAIRVGKNREENTDNFYFLDLSL